MTHIPSVFLAEVRRCGQDVPDVDGGRSHRLRRRDALEQRRERERDGGGAKDQSRGGKARRGFHQNTRHLHGCDVRTWSLRLRLRFPPASSATRSIRERGENSTPTSAGMRIIVVVSQKCNHSLSIRSCAPAQFYFRNSCKSADS